MSVRKSHNLGRNHIKLVVEYYEQAALEENLLPGAFPSAAVAAAAGGDPALAAASSGAKLNQSKELDSFSEAGAPGTEGKSKEDLFDELVGDRCCIVICCCSSATAKSGAGARAAK
ncbi:hypothetical protein D0Z03_002382 [Geotrichum reessii]|nr:hypothetical protein D0Z03_002382 [Galactomyces reessii]